ncbi:MAG: phosphoenolpyruvate carboxykinase (GTP) [Desulfobacteraceae bacterium 4572_130]|nr:MAG: phosphoenolpyruvate carboxykinase (GTP) [Desulfobacteraceae bacterium 4572_130]
MLDNKIKQDIICDIGGIYSKEDIKNVFKQYLNNDHFLRMETIQNHDVRMKIANAIVLCKPKSVYINQGTENDRKFIRESSIKNGEEKPLAMENHTIHFDLKKEQGRIIDRTFYIADKGEYINSLAKSMDRAKALKEIKDNMTGIMENMVMVIGFYTRGPAGSPASNPALEITSSFYVSHSAEILYRNVFNDFNYEVERAGHFFTNIHSQGLNRAEDLPSARVFMDRKNQTTYSFNCTYAGNTLLLKKGNHRFSVDKAVYKSKGKEIAEHMFITGIKGTSNRVTWCVGAAPSGCGKTTTAMAGDFFVGDDLAHMWIASDGSIRSINPECGIFGIVEDVNQQGDPILMERLRNPGSEVIWSNVLIDENNIPHWVGNEEKHPEKGFNFQGPWEKGMTDKNGNEIPISHPNARCTIASNALSCFSSEAENPDGVETRIFTYSGRDSGTMPPVWVAKNSDYGVVIGACIVSSATATEVGASGVKRAPWANAPFIPGSLGDYMNAQFEFFRNKLISHDKKPVLAGLNYFLTDEERGGNTKKLLGEKRDVKVWLSWLERYTYNEVEYITTPIGNLPKYNDLKNLFKTLINKDYSRELYVRQFSLYVDKILERIDMQTIAYKKEKGVGTLLFEILENQKQGLLKLKKKFGSIIKPDELE